MKAAVDHEYRAYVRSLAKRGIKVHVMRQGEGFVVRREVPEARRRAAIDALLARLRRRKPARPGELTASALIRGLREGGRY